MKGLEEERPSYGELEQRCRRAESLLEVLLLGSVVPGDDGVETPLSAAWWDASGVSAARSLQGALLDAIPAPVFYKDLSGRYLGVNRAFAEFQGCPAGAFLGKTVYDVAPPELAEQYHVKDLELFRDGEMQVYASQMRNAQGELRDVVFHKAPLRGADGAVRGLIGVIQDVTERNRAEEALARSQGFLRTLVDTIPDLIWLKDPQGVFLSCNPPFERFLGAREEEILGRRDEDFLDRDQAAFFREHDRLAAEAGGPRVNEEWLVFRDGSYQGLFETIKTPMWDLEGNLVGVLGISRDITAHKRTEEALRAGEELWRSYVENAPYGIFVTDGKRRILQANAEACRMSGYSEEELLARSLPDLLVPDSLPEALSAFQEVLETGRSYRELGFATRAGEPRRWSLAEVRLSPTRFLGYARDITARLRAQREREQLREQLLHSQKMESVGRLAGGVAHDFNNMLGVILGQAEIALARTEPSNPLHGALKEIRKAAARSADLTRQLLAFARKQASAPQVLDLNETVEGLLGILHRLLGEDIRLDWIPGEGGTVRMDPAQVDQILANLCVNARDAIDGVGRIVIATARTTLREAPKEPVYGVAVPGEYAVLSVGDDGFGMDEETRSHLFEPFFTTKVPGQGTGLGLATVYGLVTQNRGFLQVDSAPGKGSAFRVYLPWFDEAPSVAPDGEGGEVSARSQGETLLLVEDEPAILRVVKILLEGLGYRVLAAGTPREALELARRHRDDIRLLVTDVVMPEMNGRELAEAVQGVSSRIRCLFMSGYAADVLAERGIPAGARLLQKPFSSSELAAKVREVLDLP